MSQPCMWLTAHKRSHFSRASIKPLSWFWHSLYKQNHIKIFLKCFHWGSYKKYLLWANMQKFVKWCIKSWRQYVQLWRFFCTKSANTRFRRAAFPVRLTLQFPFFHKSPWFFCDEKNTRAVIVPFGLTYKRQKKTWLVHVRMSPIHTLQSWIISVRFHGTLINHNFLAITLLRKDYYLQDLT